MRIFLISAFFLLLTSCDLFEGPTTVEVINNLETLDSGFQQLDGTLYEVLVLYYQDSDMIGQESLVDLSTEGGSSGVIEVSEHVEKVKVSFTFLPYDSEYADIVDIERRYTAAYTILEPNEINIITLDGSTLLSGTAKKTLSTTILDFLNAQNHNP